VRKDHRIEHALINEQGLDGVLQASVALLPVAFKKDLRPQRVEEREISLDDRPFLLMSLKRSLGGDKVRFGLAELLCSKRRVNGNLYDLSPFEAFFEPRKGCISNP